MGKPCVMKSADTIIFCDGSCLRNPDGPGGWAAIVALGETVVERGGHEPSTTNNRMEMVAAIEGLSMLPVESTGWIIVTCLSEKRTQSAKCDIRYLKGEKWRTSD